MIFVSTPPLIVTVVQEWVPEVNPQISKARSLWYYHARLKGAHNPAWGEAPGKMAFDIMSPE